MRGFEVNGAWRANPLKGFPRNFPCFCDSGLKFKLCCGPKLGDVVQATMVKTLNEVVDAAKRGQRIILRSKQALKVEPSSLSSEELEAAESADPSSSSSSDPI